MRPSNYKNILIRQNLLLDIANEIENMTHSKSETSKKFLKQKLQKEHSQDIISEFMIKNSIACSSKK